MRGQTVAGRALTVREVQKIRDVHRAIARWFRIHQRDLPWRRTRDPYKILVSEVMLQQTQVERVIPKYMEFLRRFPTSAELARASLRDVLLFWAGMGYNRRALYLHRLARIVMDRFGGSVPTDEEALKSLPGVGAYTAAAVSTFSTGVPHPLADTNVRRVVGRVFFGLRPVSERELLRLVERTMPRRRILWMNPSLWGHALMDFGALVCKARPACPECPLRRSCRAYTAFLRAGSSSPALFRGFRGGSFATLRARAVRVRASVRTLPDRMYRGRILQRVREWDPASVPLSALRPLLKGRPAGDLERLVHRLIAEGLLTQQHRFRVRLPDTSGLTQGLDKDLALASPRPVR